MFLQAVDCQNDRPSQDGTRNHYDKRFCHCHPPRTDASRGHIPPKCVLGVSVAALRLAELGAVGEPQGGLAAPDLFGSKADIAVRLRKCPLHPRKRTLGERLDVR